MPVNVKSFFFFFFFFSLAVFMFKCSFVFDTGNAASVSDHRLFAFFDNEELSGAFPSGRLDCIAQFSKLKKKKKKAVTL